MAEPTVVTVTRTVKLTGSAKAHRGKKAALAETHNQWDRAVHFYVEFFLDHPLIFEQTVRFISKTGQERERPINRQELLTWAEQHTVATPAHPNPLRNFASVCPQAPKEFRRAAINAASGAVRAYLTAQKAWEATDPRKRGKTPSPPNPRPHPVAYAGLSTVRGEDFRNGFLRLKLWTGQTWVWHNIPVEGPDYAGDLFAESEREQERIRQERAAQNRQRPVEGRPDRAAEDKTRLRPQVGVWVAGSPVLIPKGHDWWIHVPFEKRVTIKGRAEDRRLTESDLRVGTFDVNAGSVAGAAWQGRQLRGVRVLWHARENAKRETALQKVARKQRASGTPIKGEHANRLLWGYVKNLDNAVAWQIARAIVDWAIALDLQVLVFEYLRSYRPKRGLSWSRRTNQKRSYWVRGKVVTRVRELALREGILVVERNPAWTSRMCPRCDHVAERFSPRGVGYPSRLLCDHCGWSGDANVAAALNLKRKWDRTCRYPIAEDRRAAGLRRAGNGGATANAETVPTARSLAVAGLTTERRTPRRSQAQEGATRLPVVGLVLVSREWHRVSCPRGVTRLPAGRSPDLACHEETRDPDPGPQQGRHERQMSGFVKQIGQLLTPRDALYFPVGGTP